MQRDEWEPQIDQVLFDANCGAEKGKWPSGHPEWRVPADKVHLLPETGQKVFGTGSGHGIPIKAWAYDGVYELCHAREHFWMPNMISDWQPVQAPKAKAKKRGKKA